MNRQLEADDVYGLVTRLSEHTLWSYRIPRSPTHCTEGRDAKIVKNLRAKAFAVLLNKGNEPGTARNGRQTKQNEIDPVSEILKHAFVLRVCWKRTNDATTLENLLETLLQDMEQTTSIGSSLRLLIELKSFEVTPQPITDVFQYGRADLDVSKIHRPARNVPPFSTYPMDCFVLSDRLDVTLGSPKFYVAQSTNELFADSTHFFRALKSQQADGTDSLNEDAASRFTLDRESIKEIPWHDESTVFALNDERNTDASWLLVPKAKMYEGAFIVQRASLATYFCPSFSRNAVWTAGGGENVPNLWKRSTCDTYGALLEKRTSGILCDSSDLLWNSDNAMDTSFTDIRRWETLGEMQVGRETAFVSDAMNAISGMGAAALHLGRLKETTIVPLLSEEAIDHTTLARDISPKDFLNDVKSLLLGLESDAFKCEKVRGFTLRRNISVCGINVASLKVICDETTLWGNCFEYLSRLVTADMHSGKFQQEGLIFKAMCASIKQLLVYYRAALLRIFTTHDEGSNGLLKLLGKVRPVAVLITEVARLCGRGEQTRRYTLAEGSGILTRIYREVRKVTDAKVALVFYSILNSCCEVYFRFLQKWIFEGVCDDTYGEFMIKTRSQYLRNRGHKFWTKSFTVHNDAVPGFLNHLTESILQCGKAVRLLRICDPKNPACAVSVSEQPEIKVCLSANMLREQLSRSREYEERGKIALGPPVSLITAIREQEALEKPKRMLRSVSQPHDQKSVASSSEEPLGFSPEITSNTEESCAGSNSPVTPARDSPVRGCEMEVQRDDATDTFEEPSRKNESRALAEERTKVLRYYEELAEEIEIRRARSHWRAKRMSHYERRIDALAAFVVETASTKRESRPSAKEREDSTTKFDRIETIAEVSPSVDTANIGSADGSTCYEDENRNITTSGREPNVETVSRQRYRSRDGDNNERVELPSIAIRLSEDTTTVYGMNDNDRLIMSCCGNREATIERPTSLNVKSIDNRAASQVPRTPSSRLYDMTPNNNERRISYIGSEASLRPIIPQRTKAESCVANDEFPKSKRDDGGSIFSDLPGLPRSGKDSNDLQSEHESQTPMSCTTDNFASSIQSPLSQLQNVEDASPMDASTGGGCANSLLIGSTDSSCVTDLSNSSRKLRRLVAQLPDSVGRNHGESAVGASSPSPWGSRLTVADVETMDHTSLQAYLEKSIRVPLTVQSRLVNNAIIKYFLKEQQLLLHLRSLRSYFFLLNGEFAKSLTDSLYGRLYEISIPIELFNSATLTNLLERALVNSFSNAYLHSELLSLSAIEPPPQLHISDPNALDCLSLNYKISWPLNILLDDTVMLQYVKIFKFLITSGRVSWVLQEDFNIMKRERKAANSEQYHKLQLYRHSMMQFMNALHNYLTCSVLHASWTEFERDLQHSTTLDQIYISHVNYIKRVLSRCMLNTRGEKMRTCLSNIFKVILKFHNRLRSQRWVAKSNGVYAHVNFKRLEQLYRAFCDLRGYMTHVAFKLATSGYQPHLMHFLNALNINDNYELSVRGKHRASADAQA